MCLSEVDSKKLTLFCTLFSPDSTSSKLSRTSQRQTHTCLYSSHTYSENVIDVSFSHPTEASSLSYKQENSQENCSTLSPPPRMQNNRRVSQVL